MTNEETQEKDPDSQLKEMFAAYLEKWYNKGIADCIKIIDLYKGVTPDIDTVVDSMTDHLTRLKKAKNDHYKN